MSAQHFYCTQCHKKSPTHHKLFDTLCDFSKMAPEDCPACGGSRELHVNLDFQLGADLLRGAPTERLLAVGA